MLNVFIKKETKTTGLGRFLESFSISDKTKIYYISSVEEGNLIESDCSIFGGFLPHEIVEKSNHKNIYYTFCSPLGQADLSGPDFYSPEIRTLLELTHLIKTGAIKNAITQSKSLSSRFGFIYVPPVKIVKNIPSFVDYKDRYGYSIVGNNFRKHRNVVNEIAAISRLKPHETIIASNASSYRFYKDLFKCEFSEFGRPDDEQYYSDISKHKLCFQCSHSEAFSYIALEYALVGVPTICGPCIDWYPEEDCIVKNIDDWSEIYWVAGKILNDKIEYTAISYNIKKWAENFNENNKQKLLEAIDENFTISPK